MERALEFAGYSVQHAWGEGSHSPRHASAIFPDAMRWLWSDWPVPIAVGVSQNTILKDILIPGESWQAVPTLERRSLKLFNDSGHRTLGPRGRQYFTISASGEVWLRPPHGKSVLLDSGLKVPTGIALSPDGLWLAVAESATHWGYSYRVQPDGRVQYKQRYYWFHVPDDADSSGAGDWVTDREGRLYAATRLGVQVFDHNGRVRAILPTPGGPATDIAFGGDDLRTLFIRSQDQHIYRRRVKVAGTVPGGSPVIVPDWGAG
jgi:gluconolactonase